MKPEDNFSNYSQVTVNGWSGRIVAIVERSKACVVRRYNVHRDRAYYWIEAAKVRVT